LKLNWRRDLWKRKVMSMGEFSWLSGLRSQKICRKQLVESANSKGMAVRGDE